MLNREQELLRKIAADKKKETDIKASLAGICRPRCDQPQANFIREQTETLADRLGQGLSQRVAGGCVLQHPAPEAPLQRQKKKCQPNSICVPHVNCYAESSVMRSSGRRHGSSYVSFGCEQRLRGASNSA
jgi:hypothetical protein